MMDGPVNVTIESPIGGRDVATVAPRLEVEQKRGGLKDRIMTREDNSKLLMPFELDFFQVGERALKVVKKAYDEADGIYFVNTGGAIGDGVMATGYLMGIKEAMLANKRDTPLICVVNLDHSELYSGLEKLGIEIQTRVGGSGKGLLIDPQHKKALVLFFDGFGYDRSLVGQGRVNDHDLTDVSNLFSNAIEAYSYRDFEDARYARFVEDLLSEGVGSIDPRKAKTTIVLPDDSAEVYQKLINQFGIEPDKPQIAMITTGGWPGKRYSLENWRSVIEGLRQKVPGAQFNVVYNPRDEPTGNYSPEALKEVLVKSDRDIRLVDGSLLELAVLLQKQNLAISNDTGFAHVALALEGGPKVVTIYSPNGPSHQSWQSSSRQIPVNATMDQLSQLKWIEPGIDVEAVKLINVISPQTVVEKSMEALR